MPQSWREAARGLSCSDFPGLPSRPAQAVPALPGALGPQSSPLSFSHSRCLFNCFPYSLVAVLPCH